MSIEIVGREIARFLSSTEPEVLCLKGKWGVGKTFTWQHYVQNAKTKNGIGLDRYAFVSLFGVNSAEQLRLSIVESTVKRDRIGDEVDLESVLADPLGSAQRNWRKLLSKVGYVPGARDIAELIQQSSFLSVRKQIICLDDLERKGDGLKIKEVLGLVSFLKEQRGCKIVLILNDGAFEKDEKDDFGQFFEKTVDSHVQFTPTAEECARIALPTDSYLHARMRDLCAKLGVSNIRVIRRIERMATMLRPILSEYHDQVFEDYLRELVVFGWCAYADDAPPLEFVKKRRSPRYSGTKEKSPEEEKWGLLLDRYGLQYFSPTSEVVLEGLQRGFFDALSLNEEAKKLHDGYVAQQSEADFHDAWQIYHRGFGDDDKELVEALNASFRKNVKYISPMNANGTVALLKDLGHKALASELIALYIESHDADRFDARHMYSENDISDAEFNEAVKRKVVQSVDTRDPKGVLLTIARQRGWDKSDIELLSKVDAAGYYKMFKEIEDGDELSSCIRMALGFGTIGGVNEAEKALAQNAKDALIKIAAESVLNKRRVEKYGFKIE